MKTMMTSHRLALSFLLLLLSCGGSDEVVAPTGRDSEPVVSRVTIAPGVTQLIVGDTTRLVATAISSAGGTIQVSFVWTSSDVRVAAVDSSGLVLGEASGTASIQASARGFTGQSTVSVLDPPNELPVVGITSPASGSSFGRGRTVVFEGGASDAEDGELPDSSLEWVVDGSVAATGRSFVTPDLNVGERAVKLVATDSQGGAGADSIFVTIEAPTGTDTLPPTLINLVLSKDTLTVGNQPDTVLVTMRLTEDITGIRLVAAQFLSTATSQIVGWTELERVQGDYYEGVFSGPLVFGQNAATGQWDLRVTATDHAGNLMAFFWTELANLGLPAGVVVR
jgi:Bacterial Ig-like domain (group 2)/Bacterial Ig domain